MQHRKDTMASGITYYYKVYCEKCGAELYSKVVENAVLPRTAKPKDFNHTCPTPRKKAVEGPKITGKIQWP